MHEGKKAIIDIRKSRLFGGSTTGVSGQWEHHQKYNLNGTKTPDEITIKGNVARSIIEYVAELQHELETK